MASMLIKNACGAIWNIVLLSIVDAWNLLPSYEEVFELLSDIGLEQLGLLSFIMQHPLIRIAMGRLLEVLKSFANVKSELEASKTLLFSQGCLLDEKEYQIEALQMQNVDLTADLTTCKEMIASLQQQMRVNAQAAMSGATQQDAALALARSKQAEAERTARDMAAVAAAVEQRCASLEVALQEQGETYETEIACLTTEVEQAHAAVATAMEQADAQVCTNKQLLERLQLTEAGRDSLISALTAEQEARARAELRLASSQRVHGDHVAVLGLFAQQQTGAKEAAVAENRTLRSRLSALEQQPRQNSAAANPASPTSNRISAPTRPADPASFRSASAGFSELTASQAAEVEREPLLETLSAEEGHQRCGSVSSTAAATLLCIGNASARAGYRTVPQEEENTLPELKAAPMLVSSTNAACNSGAATPASPTSNCVSIPVTPSDPTAAASFGAVSTSGFPALTASQAAEAEQETLLETLSAEEGQQRHGSVSATAAAVLLCIGNASARAGYQTVPQEEESQIPEQATFSGMSKAAPILGSSATAAFYNGAAASKHNPVKGLLNPVGLTRQRGWGRYQKLCQQDWS